MRRFISSYSRYLKPALLGSTSFTAGCLLTAYCLSGDRIPANLPPLSVAAANLSQPDFPPPTWSNHAGPVFLPTGPLPQPVAQVGIPGAEPVKILPGFLCLYDRRSRIPRWTLELISNNQITGNASDVVDRSQFEFFEDLGEPPEFRSTNKDFYRSGFDRGHMAAAGNSKMNADAMKKTFVLSNVAPQVGVGFNRGIWNDLEKYVRAMARKSENLVVVTGPLFLPGETKSGRGHRQVVYEVIGPNNVAVPTHFFKAVAVQGSPGGGWKTYAWLMPNQYLPEGTRVNSFSVPLKDLERAAGLVLFPNLYKS